MIIDFEKMEDIVIPSLLGGEKETSMKRYMDDDVKIMLITLVPGATIGLHQHTDSSEIIYILSGHGSVIDGDKTEELKPGICHYCPTKANHSVRNTGDKEDLVFFAVVPKVKN